MTEAFVAQPIPYRDPVTAFGAFAGAPHAVLLDSAATAGGRGRYSYIAADPFRVIVAGPDGASIDGVPAVGDPFALLAAELTRFRLPTHPGLPPFQTGAVGYLNRKSTRLKYSQ